MHIRRGSYVRDIWRRHAGVPEAITMQLRGRQGQTATPERIRQLMGKTQC